MLFAGLNPLQGQGRYFDISKNLEIFANAYKEVNHSYVDDLDPSKVMRSALDAMLEGLDPYTNYISETDIEGYRIQTDGKYNGIGAQGFKMGDFVVITDIDENSPAHKAGLKAGDAIVSVDGQSAMGKTEAEVLAFLRGFPGTEADLLIRRPGENKDLKIKLTREEVDIPNVPHSGLVSENVGYVYLSTFTREAARNVGNAIQAMINQNPDMKGVILDLRGNGGGLLNEAVNLVNLFVPRGEIVAVTKGKVREWNNTFKTINGPLDENIPVVVLLDKMSASASEVTAGALQDLDRAVLMGQRSYGKGLVQNMLDIGYNARVKVTTAKYYIPSGRCIQAVRYRNGEPVDIPESERAQFKTRNGRTVLDGGGVKPDVLLPHDTATGVVKALLDQHIIFDFATQFALKHESIDSAEAFTFTDWDGFMQFAKSKNFDYESVSEKKLKELKTIASSENFALDTDIQALENRIKAAKKNELNNNKARIMHEIEQEIVGRYYFQRGKVRKNLKNDPEVDAAVKLLNDEARYRAILAGNS
ncbi:MAG: S41 family peptidase [Saprospiraceae bacterium]|nr:S41 family peptidase [Saprospiraceae bacterium]